LMPDLRLAFAIMLLSKLQSDYWRYHAAASAAVPPTFTML
jgi:hypothetical protein